MADYVSIANLAASKIGEDDQLRSPDDDTHLNRTVRAVWDMMRRAAIRDHSWNFAIQRRALAAEALSDVPYPWKSSFRLPAESLRLIEVLNAGARSNYQVEGKAVLANITGPLYVRYLVDITEPALWDDLFVDAFACRLAYQIGARIVGGEFDKNAAWKVYQDSLNQAKRTDALENPQVPYEATSWETARTGGCFGSRGDWAR